MMEENTSTISAAVLTELNEIYRDIIGTEQFFSGLFTIHKLISNITTAPEEAKFRKLNLNNPNISALFSKSPAVEKLFRILKFKPVEQDQFLQLGQPGQPVTNLNDLKVAIQEIEEFGNKISKLL